MLSGKLPTPATAATVSGGYKRSRASKSSQAGMDVSPPEKAAMGTADGGGPVCAPCKPDGRAC
eukprot:1503035-Pyramimonas_sp.AAC.1